MRTRNVALAAAAAVLALALAGCGPAFVREKLPAAQRSEQKHSRVETQTAETAEVRLVMGVGELRVSGGAAALMEADFDFQPASWQPDVVYRIDGTRGVLSVEQPANSGPSITGRNRNVWDVRLSDTVPLDLNVSQGVGKSELRLGGMDLRTLRVQGGAGDTVIDLTGGAPKQDVSAEIESGVGSLELKVPREVGVRLRGIKDGVGDWKAEGFTQSGDNEAVNAAWDTAKVQIDVVIQRGVGSVKVEQL